MKKSLVLGAAALATLVMAAPQDSKAGEIKVGGYYMFRMQDADSTVSKEGVGVDTLRAWSQRVQLNTDFIQDKSTHAHLVVRVLDSSNVSGIDSTINGSAGSSGVAYGTNGVLGSANPNSSAWNVRKAWMETDLWGVGLKVGVMPAALNDNILLNNDDTGYAAIKLSKTFGDVTAVLANLRVDTGNLGTCSNNANGAASGSCTGTSPSVDPVTGINSGYGSNNDNENLYALALFGKVDAVNYGVTGAYLYADRDSVLARTVGTPGTTITDGWLALTLNTNLAGMVDVTGTGIWETGARGVSATTMSAATGTGIASKRVDGSGGLAALRLKGDLAGISKGSTWRAYGVYASENFTAITSRNPVWSKTWDLGGPGAQDLMNTWAYGAGASPEENIMALGVGASFVPAPNWTISPMLDFAKVTKDSTLNATSTDFRSTSAWGGGVEVATKLNPATTLAVTGLYVSPNDKGSDAGVTNVTGSTLTSGVSVDKMHVVEATLKMEF
ncbi:MAG: hypothetical protein H7838_12165 [Magnetococcus sp. DMHC-8]